MKKYTVDKMSDSIKVAIKVRPLIKREKDENLPKQWKVHGNYIVSTDPEMKKRGDGGFHFGMNMFINIYTYMFSLFIYYRYSFLI